MIVPVSQNFTSALHSALNSQLLLFQHAHPGIPVAQMHPEQAFDVGMSDNLWNSDRLSAAVRFLRGVSQGLPEEEIPENVSRAIKVDLSTQPTTVPDWLILVGARRFFDEPLKKVLERFQVAESVRKNPNDEGAWLVYGDWLLEQGDPRGEVIQLERIIMKEIKDNLKLERVTKRLDKVDLKPLKSRKHALERRLNEEWGKEDTLRLSWRNGYFDNFEMTNANRDQLNLLFASEEARFLRILSLKNRQVGPLLECLSVFQLNSVVTLHLNNAYCRGDDLANFIMESSSNDFRSLKSLTLRVRSLSVPVGHRLCNWALERGIELV